MLGQLCSERFNHQVVAINLMKPGRIAESLVKLSDSSLLLPGFDQKMGEFEAEKL